MNAFFNIGSLYFDIFSIVFIVILLISVIAGAHKGFLRTLVGFLKIFAVLAAAILLCRVLGGFIYNLGIGNSIANSYESGLLNMNHDVFSQIVNESNKEVLVPEGVKLLNIPSIFHQPLINMVLPMIDGEGTVAHFVAKGFASYTTTAIAFVIIVILGSIACVILKHFAKVIHNAPVIGGFDKLLGFVLGAAICYIVLDAILFGASFIIARPEWEISQWISNTMYLNDDSVMTISKWMYQNNLTSIIISNLMK